MSTHDYAIANAGFPTVRSDINSALGAIQTNNLSATTFRNFSSRNGLG